MPTSAPHACAQPGCPALVHGSKARCPTHERRRDQERGSATARGYDARWRAARLQYLKKHSLCVQCGASGRTVPAQVVDHVVAHKGDQVLFWDQGNWQALCERCHNRKVDEGDFIS